ncbi:MAG: isoprenylcysteine carboxylmethyltransferase family protein [Anaerolineae bacterium]|jgi:protein-S-isoprenylcysteine O-methyltransferase Ste14
MRDRLEEKAHLIVLLAGLLNVAVLPIWQLPIARAMAQAVGYPLLGLGLFLNLLSLLALKRSSGGEIEPVTELVTGGNYARLRHPMYVSFAVTMGGLDLLLRSPSGTMFTIVAFVPSMVWRACLEEQALARHFGQAWKDYVHSVPSLLLWDLKKE